MNIVAFETQIASRADELLALKAILELLSQKWTDTNGSGYESVYNGLAQQTDTPANGVISKNEMNNVISAINAITAAINTSSAALHIVADYAPELSGQ